MNEETHERTKRPTERRKLYTPRNKCRGYKQYRRKQSNGQQAAHKGNNSLQNPSMHFCETDCVQQLGKLEIFSQIQVHRIIV